MIYRQGSEHEDRDVKNVEGGGNEKEGKGLGTIV